MLDPKQKEYVRAHTNDADLLCQLAEESAELAQAALKLRRTMTGVNPTPVSMKDALKAYQEEIADVLLCLYVLGYDPKTTGAHEAMEYKLTRWVTRLKLQRGEPVCPKDGGYCNDAYTTGCADCGGTTE